MTTKFDSAVMSTAGRPRPKTVSLGGGLVVPYPTPGSVAATNVGKANRRTGSKPEEGLRRVLHRAGLRYRKNLALRVADVRTNVDIVFGPTRVAVFVDGCFWHRCPEHFTPPRSNVDYWAPKIARNVTRDRRVVAVLERHGWTVVRIWEHEPVIEAAHKVLRALATQGHPRAVEAGLRLTIDP